MNQNDDDLFISEKETQKSELDLLYEYGTLCVRRQAAQMNKEALLYLYSRFKYVTEGPCNTDRPSGLFNFEAKSKWDAWKSLGDKVSKDQCQQEYIKKLDEHLPNWREGYQKDDQSEAEKKGTFGVRMSTMLGSVETPLSLDMNCFDVCKEDNLNNLKTVLSKNINLINESDENGMTMLMWACDRGNLDIVKYLLENGAQVNKQDNEGQTCLHYAVECEHFDIINYLLSLKILDKNLKDNDGLAPIDLTDNKEIIELLQN